MPKPIIARTAFAAGLFFLAACNQSGAATGSEPASAPPAAAAPTAAPAPATSDPVLTTAGLGPMRIGMTDAEARAAAGAANIEADTGTEISDSCTEIKLKGDYPGVYLMINDGKLSRITLYDNPRFKTDRGIGVGATPADVMAAYPGIVSSPHEYENPPAVYLTLWTKPEKEGVRFEINHEGVVGSIHAGDDTIQYVEGCA
jgi:hypothetical protein